MMLERRHSLACLLAIQASLTAMTSMAAGGAEPKPAPAPSLALAAPAPGEKTNASSPAPARRLTGESSADLFAARSWYVPPPPASAPAPSAPPFPYQYSGSMDEGGQVVLFLRRGERNYMVRRGEQIDGQYVLEEVANGIARFEYLPLHEKQSLSIGKN